MSRPALQLLLALALLVACDSEQERTEKESEAAWDSMVERSRGRPAELDTMPEYGIPRRDSASAP